MNYPLLKEWLSSRKQEPRDNQHEDWVSNELESILENTATITFANIDSEIARKWGMDKGKKYTIALLGEVEWRDDG